MLYKEIFIYLAVIGMNFSASCSKIIPPSLSDEEGEIENPQNGNTPSTGIPFENMLGINGFDWEYTSSVNVIDEQKFQLIQPFTGFRQYLDWERIEEKEGYYRFSYDKIYERNKQHDIATLVCLQIVPTWFRSKYYPGEYNPADPYNSLRDYTPIPKGANKSDPASYTAMAKLGFQVAARYGKNTDIPRNLVKAVTWGDREDIKIGLGTLEYIECSNEPDKDWRGPNAQQSPEEYAAQLSAFYDGHMGTLGEGVGVKNADPDMKVVMAGIAFPNPEWVDKMIAWCKKNRVKDGDYSLCFDVINYHEYSSKRQGEWWGNPDLTVNHGMAPELTDVGNVATAFVNLSKEKVGSMEVWVTECGFDVNERSIQRALTIGNKTIFDTQADWILRTALLYGRKGIDRVFFYMLNDVDINIETQYASSGLAGNNKRRPALDFLLQARNLLGAYSYSETVHEDPLVDVYVMDEKKMYVLTVPDQTGREENYTLKLNSNVKEVNIHTPRKGADTMSSEKKSVNNGAIEVKVTETPLFVEVL
ncbi:hypothetical protein [Parapedobacter tibetensis]|uniref:hypothetical protein n=1 Tax=Parapedobacter tibetensis TaxID=2972951 RepID=UPI00214DE3EB|nr:hypothetical protein [Parapedobacter tibetensis]